MLTSIGKQSGESVESVLKKKKKATVGRLKKTGSVIVAFCPDPACVQFAIRYGVMNSPSGVNTPNSKNWGGERGIVTVSLPHGPR